MRQLWPLNRASLETGPFFPFDNGPNGVNTLVAPQWLTRWVLFASPLYCRDQASHARPVKGASKIHTDRTLLLRPALGAAEVKQD